MKDNIIINILGMDKYIVKEGTTVENLLPQVKNSETVIAVKINNEIVELSFVLTQDTELELITINDRIGRKIYRSGLKFLYITAIKEIYGEKTVVNLKHSIDKGIYSVLELNREITQTDIDNIKRKMEELVSQDLIIEKVSTSRKSAIQYFEKTEDLEKVINYKQMSIEFVTLYQLLNYYNYFYYFMPTRTGILKQFDLSLINSKGIVLRYPSDLDNQIPNYNHAPLVLDCFHSYTKWCDKLKINYAADINNIIINGKIKEFIRINELKLTANLASIANQIYQKKDEIKVILVAGPSSSGKTTTSRKLALYLKTFGCNPFVMSTDDYYKERKDNPKDEEGNYLYDIVEALDVELFNSHLKKLLNNESVVMPQYNFVTGEKEYKKKAVSLENRDFLIIEGLHTLNDKLTEGIEKQNKFKIYVSPFTPIGLDKHNHISTVDMRLIRRMVRDNEKRGYTAEETLHNWKTVRIAEEKFVFPYQNDADVIVNTALVFELGLLKTYVVPLLYSVNETSEYYIEALRINNFLKGFFAIPTEYLPRTSVLREFVGNGYFE